MKISHTTGGDLSNVGGFIKEEGCFHFIITAVNNRPMIKHGDKKGTLLDTMLFEAQASILAGTVPNCRDLQYEFQLYRIDLSSTAEQQERAIKTLDKFWVATQILTPAQVLEKGVGYDIDLEALIGRQLMARLSKKQSGYLTPWSDYYHPDDPAMKDMPKDLEAIKLIPANQRWIGQNAPPKAAPPKPAAPSKPALSDDELVAL